MLKDKRFLFVLSNRIYTQRKNLSFYFIFYFFLFFFTLSSEFHTKLATKGFKSYTDKQKGPTKKRLKRFPLQCIYYLLITWSRIVWVYNSDRVLYASRSRLLWLSLEGILWLSYILFKTLKTSRKSTKDLERIN